MNRGHRKGSFSMNAQRKFKQLLDNPRELERRCAMYKARSHALGADNAILRGQVARARNTRELCFVIGVVIGMGMGGMTCLAFIASL